MIPFKFSKCKWKFLQFFPDFFENRLWHEKKFVWRVWKIIDLFSICMQKIILILRVQEHAFPFPKPTQILHRLFFYHSKLSWLARWKKLEIRNFETDQEQKRAQYR